MDVNSRQEATLTKDSVEHWLATFGADPELILLELERQPHPAARLVVHS